MFKSREAIGTDPFVVHALAVHSAHLDDGHSVFLVFNLALACPSYSAQQILTAHSF